MKLNKKSDVPRHTPRHGRRHPPCHGLSPLHPRSVNGSSSSCHRSVNGQRHAKRDGSSSLRHWWVSWVITDDEAGSLAFPGVGPWLHWLYSDVFGGVGSILVGSLRTRGVGSRSGSCMDRWQRGTSVGNLGGILTEFLFGGDNWPRFGSRQGLQMLLD
jgi:hypothetical protein